MKDKNHNVTDLSEMFNLVNITFIELKMTDTLPESKIKFFPPNGDDKTEREDIEPLELTQASLCLLINLFLFASFASRQTLRKRKSHQLFLNVIIVHILSGIANIISNLRSTNIIIINGLVIEMFESLIFLTCERVVALKYVSL